MAYYLIRDTSDGPIVSEHDKDGVEDTIRQMKLNDFASRLPCSFVANYHTKQAVVIKGEIVVPREQAVVRYVIDQEE